MGFIDTWYDLWRLMNLLLGMLCGVWLVGGYIKQNKYWNDKSRDLWYSRLMWSVVQCVVSIEGLQKGAGWSYTLTFISIAGLCSFSALRRKGEWGFIPSLIPEDKDGHA